MRASTIWVLLGAMVLTLHGGFTVASTLVLEDKVARLQAYIDSQGDASSDLSTCTEILSRAVRSEVALRGATGALAAAPPGSPESTAEGVHAEAAPVLLTSTR